MSEAHRISRRWACATWAMPSPQSSLHPLCPARWRPYAQRPRTTWLRAASDGLCTSDSDHAEGFFFRTLISKILVRTILEGSTIAAELNGAECFFGPCSVTESMPMKSHDQLRAPSHAHELVAMQA